MMLNIDSRTHGLIGTKENNKKTSVGVACIFVTQIIWLKAYNNLFHKLFLKSMVVFPILHFPLFWLKRIVEGTKQCWLILKSLILE